MTKQEFLKIYSAYLPYDLQINHIDYYYEEQGEINTFLESLHTDCLTFKDGADFYFENSDVIIKPILYSMDMLTKEIEYKGEKFIPIVELLKRDFPNQKGRYAETDFSTEGCPTAWFVVDAGKSIRVSTCDLPNERQWVVESLIEWHFNVFMISENAYIKKETLKP